VNLLGIVSRTKRQSVDSFGIQSCSALRFGTRHNIKSNCNRDEFQIRIPVESRSSTSNILIVKSNRRYWFSRNLNRITIFGFSQHWQPDTLFSILFSFSI